MSQIRLKKIIFSVIPIVVAMSVTVHAAPSTKALNWYCKNNDEHNPPELPSEFSEISNFDGYYLDTKADENDKVIYLTFDAGYENGNIEKILDALKAHNAQGAFFILGNPVKQNTALIRRMKDEGHLVCNHTNNHHDMTKVSKEEFKAELEGLASLYKEYTGCDIDMFYRPPEGRFNTENLKWASEMGYKTIFWSFAYADWDNEKQMSPDKAFRKVIGHTHNGEVILLHPTSATNAAIMDRLLTEWESEGYRFGSLYELTGTKKD